MSKIHDYASLDEDRRMSLFYYFEDQEIYFGFLNITENMDAYIEHLNQASAFTGIPSDDRAEKIKQLVKEAYLDRLPAEEIERRKKNINPIGILKA